MPKTRKKSSVFFCKWLPGIKSYFDFPNGSEAGPNKIFPNSKRTYFSIKQQCGAQFLEIAKLTSKPDRRR